ncbi:MAG: hypothetical protein PHC62_05670, partial [Candidatus Izemoplasmatales bacterium]|nr:hypothetical protein [Candidatus Izemoplasmatales bacterium]
MNKNGFSTLEAIASILIISLVLFSSITILINNRVQANATANRLIAYQVGQNIRDNITHNTTYSDAFAWLNNNETKTISSDNCAYDSVIVSCDDFSYVVNNISFADLTEITFYQPSTEDQYY